MFYFAPCRVRSGNMSKWKNVLDMASSIAILCVCVLIGIIGVRKYLHSESLPSTDLPHKGTQIELAGIDWGAANRTLVLTLSTQCHFCNESSDFYRRLAPAAIAAKIPLVAVFPQSREEARAHWISEHLSTQGLEFVQVPSGRLPISGTPTLILVDHKGVVLRAWVGKLPPSGEAEVIHDVQQ